MSHQLDPRLHDGQPKSYAPAQASDTRPPGPYYHHTHSPAGYDQSPSSSANDGERHQNNADPDDPKRPRACESCRGLKVRCDQNPTDPDAPCKRCAKANRQCIYTQPSRKRQKKADSRVADLEKKLDALTAALQAQHYNTTPSLPPLVTPPSQSPSEHRPSLPRISDHYATPPAVPATEPLYNPNKRARTDAGVSQPPRPSEQQPTIPTGSEEPSKRDPAASTRNPWPIDQESQAKLISSTCDPAKQQEIMDRFLNECVPTLPWIAFPAGTTAKHLLDTRPAVLLAILTTAGFGMVSSETTNALLELILDALAEYAVSRGMANFDIVQMILIVTVWIKAPSKPDRSGFYMTVHLACTMAVDLGLGRRYNPRRVRKGFAHQYVTEGAVPKFGPTLVNSDTLEARRTWLACFYCASSASTALRRPNLLRWSAYMQECVEVLETSPERAPTDTLWCQYVRIQKICDDVFVCFKMDDPMATSISISDPKVSYQLEIYEQQITDWEKALTPEHKANKRLMFFTDVAYLYLHEIALHVNHNVDDFQLPFTEDGLTSNSSHTEILTQRQMASLEACLMYAHRVIETFCDFGPDGIAITPTLFYFVRCMYALIVLIKMHLAVTAPGSEVAKIITPEKVRVMESMERIWTMFKEMDRFVAFKPPPKALHILTMLREWLIRHQDGMPSGTDAPADTPAPSQQQAKPARPLNPASSRLQLLSEAAAAGAASQAPNGGSNGQYSNPPSSSGASWTFDSPAMMPPLHKHRHALQGRAGSDSTTTPPTPQMNWSFGDASGGGLGGQAAPGAMYGQSNDMDADWMAGMDLDQLLDGAFRGLDASGDMGGFLFGDGVGADQLPADVAQSGAGQAGMKWQ